MTDCCSSDGSGFPDASTLAGMSTNWPVVWAEISALQQAILTASSQCPSPCNGPGGNPGLGGKTNVCIGGTTPMTYMSGITAVTVISGGAGYYIDKPSVKFIPPYGVTIPPADVATGTVTTNGTSITGITVIPGSAGYQPRVTTASVSSLTGTGAVLSVVTSSLGTVYSISVITPGSGYTPTDTINIVRAIAPNIVYTNASAVIGGLDVSGGILSVNVLVAGTGYEPSVTRVSVVSSVTPSLIYPVGTGLQSSVLTDNITGEIQGVVIINGGHGYANLLPQLVVTDPGTGVVAVVALNGALVVPPGNSVTSVTITNSGNNYTQDATATIVNPVTAPAPTTPAQILLTIPVNPFCTNPNLYYQVWAGTVTNSSIQSQLDFVRTYFTNLGYNVKLGTNPATGSTLEWCICW